MAKNDLRLDVPARSFIRTQLISLLKQGGTLFEAKKRLFSMEPYESVGFDEYAYEVYDHSLVISLLFCLIVIPREILDLDSNHSIYRHFEDENVIGLFTIIQPPQIETNQFFKLLRNSVAHALFSITIHDETMVYEFWTERKPIFRATIAHDNLIKFLSIVGAKLANAVLEYKQQN